MIRRAVVYSAEAERDLAALYDYLAVAASPAVAITFMRRVRTWLDVVSTSALSAEIN